MKKKRIISTIFLLMFAFPMMLISQEVIKPEPATKSMIEHHLMQKGLLSNNNIQISITDKVVTLTGEVLTINDRKRSEREVKNMEETYSVVNNLKVKYSGVPDSVLVKTIQNRIDRYVFYSIFDWVTVEANKGAVTLKGYGHLPWTARQIQNLVEKIKDVQKIDNQIEFVQGPDEIRYQAARAIYDDPMFEYYAYEPGPPIHIIVKGPDVILEGNVHIEPDRNWAGILAEFNTDAVHIVNNINVIKK